MAEQKKAPRAVPVQNARIYPHGGLDILSHREVARLLGRTETWSKTVLCRARGQLARLLQTENGR